MHASTELHASEGETFILRSAYGIYIYDEARKEPIPFLADVGLLYERRGHIDSLIEAEKNIVAAQQPASHIVSNDFYIDAVPIQETKNQGIF